MVSILSTGTGINVDEVKATMRRQKTARTLIVHDMVALMDLAHPLAAEAKPLQEAHKDAGGLSNTFV